MSFLVDWFASQCDGDWEHDTGIQIETLDNPGWSVDIRIEDTDLQGIEIDWVQLEEDESRWLFWRSTGLQFQARCGARDLERALAAFEAFASQHG